MADRYDALDARGLAALASDAVVVEPPPRDGDPRWGITAVLRPGSWTPALAECARAGAAVLGPGHAVYDADGLHVTVRAIEGFRGPVDDDDPALATYAAAIRDVVARTAPIAVRLDGLAAAPNGIVVRGRCGTAMRTLRDALHARLAPLATTPPGPEMDRADLRRTVHATLAVYGGPVARADDVAAFVRSHRTTPFGAFVADALWLVSYCRSDDAVRVETHVRIPFGKSA